MASWPGEGEHGLEDQDGGGLGLPAVARIGEGRAPCWIPLLPGLLDPLRVTRRWCRGGGDRYDGGDRRRRRWRRLEREGEALRWRRRRSGPVFIGFFSCCLFFSAGGILREAGSRGVRVGIACASGPRNQNIVAARKSRLFSL